MIRNGELPPDYVLTGDEPPQPEPPKVEPEPVKVVPLAAAPVASPSKLKPKPVKAQVQTPVSVPKPVKPLIPADPEDPTVAKKRSHKKGQGIAAMAAKAAQDGKWIVSLADLLQWFTFARVLIPFHLSLIFQLNCEICKTVQDSPLQHGPVACCEKCSQWQHTSVPPRPFLNRSLI